MAERPDADGVEESADESADNKDQRLLQWQQRRIKKKSETEASRDVCLQEADAENATTPHLVNKGDILSQFDPDQRGCCLNHEATIASLIKGLKCGEKNVASPENLTDAYTKDCRINGVTVKGFIDTGSAVNIMSTKLATRLNLEPVKKKNVLKGFGDQRVTCDTEAHFHLEINDLTLHTSAVLSDESLDPVDMIIGRPLLASVSLIIANGTVKVVKDLTSLLQGISIIEECERPKILLLEDASIPAGTTKLVPVRISGVTHGATDYPEARSCHSGLGQSVICIPAGVYSVPDSHAQCRKPPGAV